MYFIFPDNLPASVQKAAFEFTSGQFPLYRYITPDTEILNRGISIAIPDEASLRVRRPEIFPGKAGTFGAALVKVDFHERAGFSGGEIA